MILTQQELNDIARRSGFELIIGPGGQQQVGTWLNDRIYESLEGQLVKFADIIVGMAQVEERQRHAERSSAAAADVFTRMYAELVKPSAIPEVTKQEPNHNPTLTQSEPSRNPLGFSGLSGEAEVRPC